MKSLFHSVMDDGVCVEIEKLELLLVRENSYLEETYFVGQIIPIRGDDGQVKGVYNSGYQSTGQVLHEGRRI